MSEQLFDKIKEIKPNVKDKTIKMYVDNMIKLYKMITEKDKDDFSLSFLDDKDKVETTLNQYHFTTKRNYYNAIIVSLLTTENEELTKSYQDMRDKLNQQYQDEQATGIVSEKQKDALVPIEEIYKVIEEIRQEIMGNGLKKKGDLSKKEHQLLMIYLLLSIYSKYPFRNDVAGMSVITKRCYNKLSIEVKTSNNYVVIEKNKMWFLINEYKTSAKYHEKQIPIDKDLEKIFRLYFRINNYAQRLKDCDYPVIFVSSTSKPLSRNAITQLLLKTFKTRLGKNISTTMLRKIYLSSKYADVKEEMEKDAHIMGHSVSTQQKIYVKEKDDDDTLDD